MILGYLYLRGNKNMEFSIKSIAMLPKHVKCQYPIINLHGKHPDQYKGWNENK